MSSRTTRILITLVVLGLVAGGAAAAYIWFAGGSGQASSEISAPTLAVTEEGANLSFQIVPEESEVRFTLSEVLRGVPTTVIGRTNQVAGEIVVDPQNPENSRVGEIRINARTLSTDNEFRNRAIRGQILQSAQDQFEYATFIPTALEDMQGTLALNQPLTFKLTGNLLIRDINNPVTFDVSATPVTETRIEGSASATITRAQYRLEIPSVPGVADVSEEVLLEIDFVATQVE